MPQGSLPGIGNCGYGPRFRSLEANAGRPFPLDHLRAAVLRYHGELCRPTDPGHPGADVAEGDRLERGAVRDDCHRLSGGIRHRPARHGPLHRSGRDAFRLFFGVGWWSVAAMMHGLAASALGFGCARFLLGLGEAGNFPAAIKTVAEWFPKRERALATGVFNSGSNAGAILAP